MWQVVDDGSDDGTDVLIESFIREGKIAIDYRRKPNGGKASAINLSLDITSTPLWVCLDSDDYFFPDAVEKICAACEGIFDEPKTCGAFCVRSDKSGAPMKGVDVPDGVRYATQFDIRYRYKTPTEYVQVYKTEVIKEFRFPVFEGEKFVTESWLQDQLDCYFTFKIFREPIMVCEYLPTGLTKNYYRLIKNNPLGFLMFYGQRVELCRLWKPRIIAAIMYNATYYSMNWKERPKKKRHWLIFLTFPLGRIVKKIKLGNV